MKDADVVVTGEGRLDHQTAMGKAPVGVAKLGRKYGAKTIAFAGSVTKEAVACNEVGIDVYKRQEIYCVCRAKSCWRK